MVLYLIRYTSRNSAMIQSSSSQANLGRVLVILQHLYFDSSLIMLTKMEGTCIRHSVNQNTYRGLK